MGRHQNHAGIETARLWLTTWRPEDWLAFRPIATDPEVMRYINGGMPWGDDTIQQFVARQIMRYQEHAYCRWKLIEKEPAICGRAPAVPAAPW